MIEYKLFIAEEPLLARREKGEKVQYLPASSNKQKPNDELIQPGRVYFAQSPRERKATGTHYTAESLVEKLVKHTAGRILEERWSRFQGEFDKMCAEIEGTPVGEGRRRLQRQLDNEVGAYIDQQILSLRICDPAMGSGHFLVHIAHTLTNEILEKLTIKDRQNPSLNLDPNYWRQKVVQQCLYGVDISKMAVELAKLSLWLATMQFGKPLTFLDHHLKQGNSLLGISVDEIVEILTNDPLDKKTAKTRIAEANGQYLLKTPSEVMNTLERANEQLIKLSRKVVSQIADIEAQEDMYDEIQNSLKRYKAIGNLLVAKKMGWEINDFDFQVIVNSMTNEGFLPNANHERQLIQAEEPLINHFPFHWELEFPQIFIKTSEAHELIGFDVVIGNPPYLGGSKISSELGSPFLNFIKETFPESLSQTDLCAYFLRNGYKLISDSGFLGMVTTNTISEGDTGKTGLKTILNQKGKIVFAKRYMKWAGDAAVEVNLVVIIKNQKDLTIEEIYLDDEIVKSISSRLDDFPEGEIKILQQNLGKGFRGQSIGGNGFVLDPEIAENILKNDSKNIDCLSPYLNGEDLNKRVDNNPPKWIINFSDLKLSEAQLYDDLISIVEREVLPKRQSSSSKREKEYWWRFARSGINLREAISDLTQVLVRSRVSDQHMLDFLSTEYVFGDALVVFAFQEYYFFALLQSNIHEIWTMLQASTLGTSNRYTPTDCFQTFPFPQKPLQYIIRSTEEAGRVYYEYRKNIILNTQKGLTETYNRFHDPECLDEVINKMRQLHTELDHAVLQCYYWDDIELNHDFYPNDRGKIRYMPSRDAQREIYSRLISLNHEIAVGEAKHDH